MVATVREKRWTPREYEHLAEVGVLGPEDRTELVDGVIYEIPRQTPRHAGSIRLIARALSATFGDGYLVDARLPLVFGRSEPQPDVSVVAGTLADYQTAHPSSAVLVGEQLEVHREPSPSGYKSITILKHGDHVSPVAKPDASIPIADLLP